MNRGQKAAPITLLHALNSNAVVKKTIDKGRFRISCISKYLFGLPYYSRDYFGRPIPGPPAWLESQSLITSTIFGSNSVDASAASFAMREAACDHNPAGQQQ